MSGDRPLRIQRGFHLAMVVFWLGMALPSVLWWKESILLVILMSLYANTEASFSAYHAVGGQIEQRKQGDTHCGGCRCRIEESGNAGKA